MYSILFSQYAHPLSPPLPVPVLTSSLIRAAEQEPQPLRRGVRRAHAASEAPSGEGGSGGTAWPCRALAAAAEAEGSRAVERTAGKGSSAGEAGRAAERKSSRARKPPAGSADYHFDVCDPAPVAKKAR